MKIGIYGYGHLGRAVREAVQAQPDMEVVGIFSRRKASEVGDTGGVPVYPAEKARDFASRIHVMLNCGSSARDLPVSTPCLAERFCVVDSFDTHARLPEHIARCTEAARRSSKTVLVGAGWDPGLFSLARAFAATVFPNASVSCFWGRGVSQGHTDAIRGLDGVRDARAYTVPQPEAVSAAEQGVPLPPDVPRHTRVCYVVAEPGADRAKIEQAIRTYPHYFAGETTEVHFVSQEVLDTEHNALPHAGRVIARFQTGKGHSQRAELSLSLASNPEFTACLLTACARAVWRMYLEGRRGAYTVLDIPLSYLCPGDMDLSCL